MVFENFAANGVRGEKKEAASDVNENRCEPGVGDIMHDESAEHAAEQGGGLDEGDERQRFRLSETRSQKQRPKGETLRDFVNTNGQYEGIIQCAPAMGV